MDMKCVPCEVGSQFLFNVMYMNISLQKLNQDTTSRLIQVLWTAVQTDWSRGKSVWGAPN